MSANSFVRRLVWRFCSGVAWLFPGVPRMTVLVYHSISDEEDFFAVSPEVFEGQMKYLSTHVTVVPLERAFAHAAGNPVEHDSVAITFDDGYADFVHTALPVLQKYAIPATVFVLGDSVLREELGNSMPLLGPGEYQSLRAPLVSVGGHGLTHRKLTRLDDNSLQNELSESRSFVERIVGAPAAYIAYPKGSYNERVCAEVAHAGYLGAVTVIERGVRLGDNAFALPRLQIDSSTTSVIFHAKLSRAADFYYSLWKLIRRWERK